MASYHSKFLYNGKDSAKDYGLIITSFDPDNGFVDSFMSMENVSDDYFDGTKKYNYGSKYTTQASIQITLIKRNGMDMTLREFREYAKWLTGAHVDSWLDMYAGNAFAYSFLGKFTNLEQYKLDGRTIGIRLTFSSVSPWAYSAPQNFDRAIKQSLSVNNGMLTNDIVEELTVDPDGVLCYSGAMATCFSVDDSGVAYIEHNIVASVGNPTDDLYNYIYLDITFENESCDGLEITNRTLDETTTIDNLHAGDIIYLSAKQFITAYSRNQLTQELVNQNRIFGDSFNFVWPRLAPGLNDLYITGKGNGTVKFTYRYPMKVGDNTMDIRTYGNEISCGDCDAIPSYNTVRWEDIIGAPTTLDGYGLADEVDEKIENIDIEWQDIANIPTTLAEYGITDAYTKGEINSALSNVSVKWENIENTPTTVEGYKITDAYTASEVDHKLDNIEIEWADVTNTPTTVGGYGIADAYTTSDVYTKTEVDEKIDNIEVSGGGSGGGSINIDEEELNSMLNDILGT